MENLFAILFCTGLESECNHDLRGKLKLAEQGLHEAEVKRNQKLSTTATVKPLLSGRLGIIGRPLNLKVPIIVRWA